MSKTAGHSRRTLKGVFKKTAEASAATQGELFDAEADSPQTHERLFHEFLDLPAFQAFRMEGGEDFAVHPEVFPLEK